MIQPDRTQVSPSWCDHARAFGDYGWRRPHPWSVVQRDAATAFRVMP